MSQKRREGVPAPSQSGLLVATVVETLRAYGDQITRLEEARQHYLKGVFDALGLRGQVHVDLDAMTYELDEELPDGPGSGD